MQHHSVNDELAGQRPLRTDDFDYDLPRELIAQAPAEPRDSCRMLVLHRDTGAVEFKTFRDIVDYLEPGDLLVANQTRVMPARLVGHKPGTGGVAECLLTNRREDLDALGCAPASASSPGASSSSVRAACSRP